jgi:hypothetical protein
LRIHIQKVEFYISFGACITLLVPEEEEIRTDNNIPKINFGIHSEIKIQI